MRQKKPQDLKNVLQPINSDGEEAENEENDSDSNEEGKNYSLENTVKKVNVWYIEIESEEEEEEEDEEEIAHQARMEVLRAENRRLRSIGEEEDRCLREEIERRDEVFHRIRELQNNIAELRRKRDERKGEAEQED